MKQSNFEKEESSTKILQDLQEEGKKATQLAIQINTKIESAQETYKKLAKISEEKYKTSNIEELVSILEERKKQNLQKMETLKNLIQSLHEEVKKKDLMIKEIQQSANNIT